MYNIINLNEGNYYSVYKSKLNIKKKQNKENKKENYV